MTKQIKLTIALVLTICLCTTSIFALDGAWANDAVASFDDWGTADMWLNNQIAGGSGYTAFFTNSFAADSWKYVTMGNNPTIDDMIINGPNAPNGGYFFALGTLTLAGTPSIDVSLNIFDVQIGVAGYGGVVAGSQGFTKTGTGRLFLGQPNTISGTVNVNAGEIRALDNNALQNADVKVNDGGTFLIGDGITANGKSVTINSGGLLRPNAGTASLNAPLTLNYPYANTYCVEAPQDNDVINLNSNITLTANVGLAVSGNGSTININAPISGAYKLNLMGRHLSSFVGTFNINAPCTYTGGTELAAWGANPRYEIGVNQAFPLDTDDDFALHVLNSSADTSVTLDCNDYTQTVGTLSINLEGSQSGRYAEITGNDAGLFIVNTFFWTSSSVNGSHMKLTGGKLVNNAATYNADMPLVITNATFIQNGNWSGGANAKFELQAGGKIGGVGFLGWNSGDSMNLVIPANATITPGNSIGTIGCWNLKMQNGSEYDWEVGDTTADMIDVRGGLDISEGGITVNVIDDGSPNGTYTLFTTVDGVVGDPATDITMNYAPTLSGSAAYLSGNNIVADVVPEPATLGILVLLGLGFLRRK